MSSSILDPATFHRKYGRCVLLVMQASGMTCWLAHRRVFWRGSSFIMRAFFFLVECLCFVSEAGIFCLALQPDVSECFGGLGFSFSGAKFFEAGGGSAF
jgi:hypothetical protein